MREHIQSLIKAGLKPKEIAVITPYNGQVNRIREQITVEFPGIEVGTVDGFQVSWPVMKRVPASLTIENREERKKPL